MKSLYKQLFSQGFAKEIAARYNRDPYNMLEKIGDFLSINGAEVVFISG